MYKTNYPNCAGIYLVLSCFFAWYKDVTRPDGAIYLASAAICFSLGSILSELRNKK